MLDLVINASFASPSLGLTAALVRQYADVIARSRFDDRPDLGFDWQPSCSARRPTF